MPTGQRVLRIGVGRSNPPYSFIENGRIVGFWVDLAREAAQVLGYTPDIKADVWDDVRDDVLAGKLDVAASMARTPEREASFGFSLPVSEMTYSIWVPNASRDKSLADLEGKTVIVQRGSMMADHMAGSSRTMAFSFVDDDADAIVLLNSGRYDAAILPLAQGYYFARTLKLDGVRPLTGEVYSVGSCFAVAKANQQLALELDAGLKVLKENGRYQALYAKWLGIYEKPLPSRVVGFLLAGLGLVAFFFLLSLAFVLTLQRTVKQRTAELASNERKYRTLVESLPQMIFVKDRRSVYISCNRRYASSLGIDPDVIAGKDDYAFYPRELAEQYRAGDQSVMTSGTATDFVERWPGPGGDTWINTVKAPIRDKRGEISGVIGIFWDISDRMRLEADRMRLEEERERSLKEKEILLNEVNHRVKNNLQLISAMLRLESDGTSNAEVARFVKDTLSRIGSIATIHEMLYITDNVSEIAVAEYMREIGRNLADMYSSPDTVVRIEVEAGNLRMDLNRMVPLGLLTNEMLTNSLKYAFPGKDAGRIVISMSGGAPTGQFVYRFTDDGVGLPQGFAPAQSKSLGMVFIHSLAKQLGGELTISSEGGLRYELRFPAS